MDSLLAFVDAIRKDKNQAIKPDTQLFKDKILDSMNILDLMGHVEHRLGRRLAVDELVMKNFESVETIQKNFFSESRS